MSRILRRIAGRLCCLGLIAGCAPAPPLGPDLPAKVLIVAVAGLQSDDPLLQPYRGDAARADDTLATGMGASAILELMGGGTALSHLQSPADPLAWARSAGLPVRVQSLDPVLCSTPEWVHSGVASEATDALPERVGGGLTLVILRRDQLDAAALDHLLELADTRTLVVVAGTPTGPRPDEQLAVGGDGSTILARLRVPVLARGRGADRIAVAGRRTLGMVLGPLHGAAPAATGQRIARWWNSYGGGMLVESPEGVVVGGSRRSTVWIEGASAEGSADSVLAAAAPAGDLLILVRGSAGADLTSLDLIFSAKPEWSGWGLEPIDRAELASPRYMQVELAAEPEGDGILLHHWTGQGVDLRVNVILEDAPWIGTPIRDATSGQWLGVNSLHLAEWSRDWWRLTRPTEFDSASWSAHTAAGVDLLWVDAKEALPVPVRLDR